MRRLAAGLVIAGILALPATAHAQTPAPPQPSCAPVLSASASTLCYLPFVGKALGKAAQQLNPVAALGKAQTGAFKGLMRTIVEAAGSMLTWSMGLLGENGGIDVFAAWFTHQYAIVALIALPFLLWAAVIAASQAAAFGTGMDVARAAFKALGAAFLMTMPVLLIVTAGLVLVDWATSAVLSAAGVGLHDNLQAFSDRLATLGGMNAAGGSLFFAVVIVIVALLGALFVWINLLVRKAAVYVAVDLAPLAMAGKAHPRSEAWSKRLSTLLAAVIASKFIIALILALAVGWFSQGDTSNMGNDLVFSFLLLIAAFLPLLLLKAGGSVLEVHQAGKLLAAKGEATSLIRRPFTAARHASTLAFARGGGQGTGTRGQSGGRTRRGSGGQGNRWPMQSRPWAPKPSPKPTAKTQPPARPGAPAAPKPTPRQAPAPQATWWPKGAKPLAPGQPRPPQTGTRQAPAPQPPPPAPKPAKPMPAPGSPGSAFPWFRIPFTKP